MPAELAPAEFAQEFVGIAGARRLIGGGKMRGVPDLARTDLAEAQMRRKAGGAVAIGPVAVFGIAGETDLQKIRKPPLARAFAGRPGFAQAAGPIGASWFKAQAFDRFACKAWSCAQVRRSGQGARRRAHHLHAPPERREDPQAPAFLGLQVFGGVARRSPTKPCASIPRSRSDVATAALDGLMRRLRDRVPEHIACAAVARDFRDDLGRGSLA